MSEPRTVDESERSVASAESLLRDVAVMRSRQAALAGMLMSLAGAGMIPFGRVPAVQVAAAIGLATIFGAYLTIYWSTRRPERFDQRRFAILSIVVAAAVVPLVFFFGSHTVFTAIVLIQLLFFSVTAGPRWAIAAACVVAVPTLAFDAAVLADWVPDVAMYPAPREAPVLRFVGFVVAYAMAIGFGLAFRRRLRATAAALGTAVAEVAAREALLREARLELEQAAGVGQPGRFTGQRFGSFTLGVLLGRGGMGEIYRGVHVETGEEAAVKFLRSREGLDRTDVERFEREAQLLASIDSKHVVRVIEIGGVDAPLPYLAMELLRGEDLASMLRVRERLPLDEVVEIVRQIAEGLEAVRAKNVVHRDLKPQNLFRTDDGTWKVLDFGLARLAGAGLTNTGAALVGTPGYMAPEQIVSDGEIDHRADVHALGVVAYRAITGHPAYAGSGLARTAHAVVHDLPRRPSERATVPRAVDDALRIALAKDPSDRYDSARTLAKALASAAGGELAPEWTNRARRLDRIAPWS